MLRIKSWLERFEAAREKDRPRKAMDWIRIPCDLQSTGYGTLMAAPNGAQHLGVFLALVELVAGLPISVRDGTLVSPQREPLTVKALSVKTRIPAAHIEESLVALKECGWLQEADGFLEVPGNSGQFLENPGGDGEGDGEGEGDGDALSKEHVNSSSLRQSSHEFTELYPRKESLDTAAELYQSIIRDGIATHQEMIAGLNRWLESEQWARSLREDAGKFVQRADVWLQRKAWGDFPARRMPTEDEKSSAMWEKITRDLAERKARGY